MTFWRIFLTNTFRHVQQSLQEIIIFIMPNSRRYATYNDHPLLSETHCPFRWPALRLHGDHQAAVLNGCHALSVNNGSICMKNV